MALSGRATTSSRAAMALLRRAMMQIRDTMASSGHAMTEFRPAMMESGGTIEEFCRAARQFIPALCAKFVHPHLIRPAAAFSPERRGKRCAVLFRLGKNRRRRRAKCAKSKGFAQSRRLARALHYGMKIKFAGRANSQVRRRWSSPRLAMADGGARCPCRKN